MHIPKSGLARLLRLDCSFAAILFFLCVYSLCLPVAGLAQFSEEEDVRSGLREHSVPFEPLLEREMETALGEFRELDLESIASHELERLQYEHRESYAKQGLLLSLDLMHSLASFHAKRNLEAQRYVQRILSNAPRDSRVYAEAALLSALQHYSHSPLRRLDIEAGLDQLRSVENSESVSASVQPELRFWIAEGYRSLGVLDQAEEYYAATLEKSSDPRLNALAAFRRAELHEYKGRYSEAAEGFLTTLETPRSPLVLLASIRRASALRSAGRYEEVLTELLRSDSILHTAVLATRTSARELAYVSPLVEELMLLRTETDRIIASTPERYREELKDNVAATSVPASPLVGSELMLLRGSALLELGRYAEAEIALTQGEDLLESSDSLVRLASPEHVRFIRNALQFERAWSLFQQKKYEAAATEFSKLAEEDAAVGKVVQRRSSATLRDRGRFADPFYEEPTEVSALELDESLLTRSTVDTTFFFYNDFPQRARFYSGVSYMRAAKLDDAERVFVALGQDRAVQYSERARYQLGLLNYARKSYLQAETLLEPISSNSTIEGAYASYLMGEMTYRRNLYARAAAYMGHALGALPAEDVGLLAKANLVRGLSLVALNSWEQAARHLAQYAAQPEDVSDYIDEGLFWLGKAYQRIGEHDSAIAVLTTLVTDHASSVRLQDAYYALAWSQFERNEFEASERSFMRVLSIDTISRYAYDVLARAGDANYALGRIEQANILLNQAVDRPAFNNYRTTRALYQLAITRQKLDSSRSAMSVLNYLLNKFPTTEIADRARFNLALSAYTINQNDRAEQEIERIVKGSPASSFAPRALLVAAEERARKNDVTGAIPFYQRIVAEYPNARETGPALFAMQDALIKLGRFPEAIAVGESFITANPDHPLNPEVTLNQGSLLLAQKQPTEAQLLFRGFIERFPEHPQQSRANFLEARSYLAMGDTAKAYESFSTIARLYDSTASAPLSFLELARIERSRSNITQASERYKAAYASRYFSNDASPVAMTEHADMLLALERDEEAMPILREITARYLIETRVGARAQMRLASVLDEAGQEDEARRLLTEVGNARLKDAVGGAAVVQLGEIEMKNSRWSEALTQLARAKKDYTLGQDAEIKRLFGVARSQEALGKKADAAYALRVLLTQRGLSASDRERASEWLQRIAPRRAKKAPAPKSTIKKPAAKKPAAKKPAKSPAAKKPAKKGGKK